MILGGSLYLLELAKNYSDYDYNLLPFIFEMILCLEYIFLCFIAIRNTRKQVGKLRTLVNSNDPNLPLSFFPGWRLKMKQLKFF